MSAEQSPDDSEKTPPAIRVERLGVTYRSGRPALEVRALHDVDLIVPHGSATGVIGGNGAGKTTLLRAIAGIVPPSAGRITVHGDVTALLALDVGLNPDLTGTENIELGCLARGLNGEQARARAPQIAEFADVGQALERPLRTYSSGMRARLAFAIAVNVDPDILLLDEALATGDAPFRAKSAARMRQLVEQASTIVLVSHALKSITDLCDQAIWLDAGRVREIGDAITVVKAYRRHLTEGD